MGSGGFGGSRTLQNTMRTHMDTSWTGYTLPKYFPAVVSAIMWGGSRKIECLVTSHIHCFAGLFYSAPPRKVSADEQMFHITFNLLLNKVNRPLFKTRIVGIIYFIIFRLTLFQLQQQFYTLLNNSSSKTITRCNLLNQGLSKHQTRHCIFHFTYN